MKKFAMCLLSALTVLSLAACTPTTEKQAETAETFETEAPGGVEDKVPDPNAPALSAISVYTVNEDKTGLTQEMDGVETLNAQSVLAKLIEYGVLPEDTLVLGFNIPGEETAEETESAAETESAETESGDMFADTPSIELAVLNISQLPEENRDLVIASIGNTFTENFNIDMLQIKVMDKDIDKVSYIDSYKKIK